MRTARCLERDWPEDATHENGNYECQCCVCKEGFIGHKRRVICRACGTNQETSGKTFESPLKKIPDSPILE